MQTHVFIATSMRQAHCSGHYTQSLLQTVCTLKEHGVNMSLCTIFNEDLAHRAKNTLAHRFMKNKDATHLLFVDADISWNPADIIHMLAADKDIICGIYPKKEINWSVVESTVRGSAYADQSKYSDDDNVAVVNIASAREVSAPASSPVEISHADTKFMLIKRAVLTELKDHVKKYYNDADGIDINADNGELIDEFFPRRSGHQKCQLINDDCAFCQLARSHEFKIWTAPWARLGRTDDCGTTAAL